MVVATFIEPVWVVLNRLICMLQPYEQLRKGNARADRSISVDYNSLPPQLVIWRAFRAGHILLALVCLMALLANVLAVALGGLLNEATVSIKHPVDFTRPYQAPLHTSRLHRGGFDQFYISMSNLTAGTPLPAWSDETTFYMPFNQSGMLNDTVQYMADTVAFGADLECVPLYETGPNNYSYSVQDTTRMLVNASFSLPSGTPCKTHMSAGLRGTPNGTLALEALLFVDSDVSNDTLCSNLILSGWIRASNATLNITSFGEVLGIEQLGSLSATWIGCVPQMRSGYSKVTVDNSGKVLTSSTINQTDTDAIGFIQPNSAAFLANFNALLSQHTSTLGATWHNDSYPSEFLSYLMAQRMNSSRFLDPTLPPPDPEDAIGAFKTLYSSLFAITLGYNMTQILSPGNGIALSGSAIVPETRIFISKPMFIICVTIMSMYIIVTLILYIRRPWNILPRMPTTIASQIAFFAASHALEDMQGINSMTGRERDKYVEGLGRKYAFGRFIGTDRKVHVGIEKEPLAVTFRKGEIDVRERKGEEVKSWTGKAKALCQRR